MHVCVCLIAQSCLTLCYLLECSPPGKCPWDSPGKNTGVGCQAVLQGVFPSQGWNPYPMSPAWQVDCLPTEPLGEAHQDFQRQSTCGTIKMFYKV